MRLYATNGYELNCRSARRPKFSRHKGATWDSQLIVINGYETRAHYDSTWGYNFYFQWNNSWWSIGVFDANFGWKQEFKTTKGEQPC